MLRHHKTSLLRRLRGWRLPATGVADLLGLLLAVAALGLLLQFATTQLRPQQQLLLADFFPEERNATFAYRFAAPEAGLLLAAAPAPGSYLRLTVASPAPLPPRELLIAGFEQGELVRTTVGEQPRVLRVLLPPSPAERQGLGLQLNTPAAKAPNDARQLGLLYSELRVVGPPPPIAPGRVALVLAVPLVVAATALGLGLGPLVAGAAALLLALLAQSELVRALWIGCGLMAALLGGRWLAPRRFAALAARLRAPSLTPAAWAIAVLVLLDAAWIGAYALVNHQLYRTHIYDLGLYDQTFWLISRFLPSYSTGAGINMVGSHAALVLYLLAPLYWLAADARLLLLAQALATALGAVPLYLLGRDRGQPWLGVLAGAVYLLHPSTQNMALFDFHVDTLAATSLLWAIWGADTRRWRVLMASATLVLICKENFALAIAMLGLLLMLRREWRPGTALLLGSAAWFVVATQVLVPGLVGQDQSLHVSRFAKYGDSVGAIVLTALTQPGLILGDLFTPDAWPYLGQLLAPFALLALLSPYALLALPTLGINLLSSMELQRSLQFQYSALAVAALTAAALHTICWLSATLGRSRERTATLVALTLGALLLLASLRAQSITPLRRDDLDQALALGSPVPRYNDYLLSIVPPNASVASSGTLQPHLTHRQQAYFFPNPFVRADYYNPADASFVPLVDYIVYDLRRFDRIAAGPELKRELLDELRARGLYHELGRLEGIVLLRRSDAPLPASCFGPGWQADVCRAP